MEHKASLSGPKGALEEFTSLHQKYTKLMHGGKECNPQVTVLYPISKQDIVDEIADELPDELTLCSFDQESKHTELRFKLKGPIQCGSLEALLQGDPIVFNPSTAFSKYKFIKASPLVTYTAVEVWTMFPIFRSIKDAGQPSFEVDRDVLIERARSFYPPWIRNNQQITTSRVDNALDFLNVIDFIDWKPGRRSIVVYSTKGSRSGEMSAYFAERLARLQKKQRKRGGKASYGKGQATIDRPWR